MLLKKKLLVLLGAGSSVSSGINMPSVNKLDQFMREWAGIWSSTHGFPNYYETIWNAITKYYLSDTLRIGLQPNFEKALGDMVALSNWMMPSPHGNTLRQIVSNNAVPPELTFPYPDAFGPSVTIADQITVLLIKLGQHMRSLCQKIDKRTADFLSYQHLMNVLSERFDVGVYNLNYDNVAVSALQGAFTGFSKDGIFEPSNVHKRQEWGFVYHLHGSVHHTLNGQFGNSIRWQEDLSEQFYDGHQGMPSDTRSDGKAFPKTTLIAGGFKLDQLLTEPFQTFYSSLVRHVCEADAIIIGGYGLGDVHVNRVLQNRMERPHDRIPTMILTWAQAKEDPMAFRSGAWSYNLCRTLATGGHLFFEPGHKSPPVISDLIGAGGFEVAAPHRIAIWHGGFVEAAPHIGRITEWLDRQADDRILAGLS